MKSFLLFVMMLIVGMAQANDLENNCKAIITEEESYCEKIVDQEHRQLCNIILANKLKGCNDLDNDALRDYCEGVVSRNDFYCSFVENTEMRNLCLALQSGYVSDCAFVQDPSLNLYCRAINFDKSKMCEGISKIQTESEQKDT